MERPLPRFTRARARKLKVADLKLHLQLQWRGLATDGKKDKLKTRLADAVSHQVAVLDQLPGKARRTTAAGPSSRSEPVEFEPIDRSKIERPVWTGPKGKFEPADHLDLTPDSHPMAYFNAFYDSSMRKDIVQNSIKYQGFLQMSKGAEARHPDAPRMDLRSVAFFHATLLLQGLNPVPSQRHLHHSSFSLKGHRAADLWARDEWIQVKAHFHVSDPALAPKFGDAKFDELYKVRPLLDHFLTNCVANVKPGREASIDEITIGFQGHHARLKQRCGKFKRAGDGFQVSCLSTDSCGFSQTWYVVSEYDDVHVSPCRVSFLRRMPLSCVAATFSMLFSAGTTPCLCLTRHSRHYTTGASFFSQKCRAMEARFTGTTSTPRAWWRQKLQLVASARLRSRPAPTPARPSR